MIKLRSRPLRRLRAAAIAAITVAGVLTATVPPPAYAATAPHAAGSSWVGTWAAGPTTVPPTSTVAFEDQTLRQVVHVSLGGDSLRVRLSNEFGDAPLLVGAAHVARGVDGHPERIAEGSDRTLTFGGRSSISIPPGAPALSDPVSLRVPARSDVVVSIYLPERVESPTVHNSAFQQNVVAAGNVVGAPALTPTATSQSWYFLSGVSVRARGSASVVALGDSITDGSITTVGANRRWPDLLAARLQADRGLRHLAVVNEGIGGNRLLHDPNPEPGSDAEDFAAFFGESTLKRFDRDVGSQPGAKYLIVLIGVNDLGHPGSVAPESEEVSAADIIAGYRQLIARAHQRGLKVFGATILPFKNTTIPDYYTPERDAKRKTVNRWIRTSGAYDGVIDFDKAMRDTADPDLMIPAFDSGDHLHPNDAGMAAMAGAIPLRLFR